VEKKCKIETKKIVKKKAWEAAEEENIR
jgi:hypothetical protein